MDEAFQTDDNWTRNEISLSIGDVILVGHLSVGLVVCIAGHCILDTLIQIPCTGGQVVPCIF